MKRETFFVLGMTALLLVAPTVASAQEVLSLRGDVEIEEGTSPPEVMAQEIGRVARNYRQQPPLVPHRIDKYQVDLKINQCLRCHDWPQNVEENAPKIGETHYLNREGIMLDAISRRRWFCTQCHVTQADAAPLVGNTFEPLQRGQ